MVYKTKFRLGKIIRNLCLFYFDDRNKIEKLILYKKSVLLVLD